MKPLGEPLRGRQHETDAAVNTLAELLPMALGMMISPLPIVAIVAIVLSPRGRVAAPAYTLSFTVVTLAFVIGGALSGADAHASGGSHTASFVLAIILTVAFAGLAVASWLSRPRRGSEPTEPGWLSTLDAVTPLGAAGLGFVMAITNSKNIPLALKGGAVIGGAHLAAIPAVLLCVVFAGAAALLLVIPTVIALLGSDRVDAGLRKVKTELIVHNAAIMTVLFALLALNDGTQVIHQLAA